MPERPWLLGMQSIVAVHLSDESLDMAFIAVNQSPSQASTLSSQTKPTITIWKVPNLAACLRRRALFMEISSATDLTSLDIRRDT